ncbi:YhcN/YlaJ family sporulation lipoprotein [Virgibacillus ainsalahensis]
MKTIKAILLINIVFLLVGCTTDSTQNTQKDTDIDLIKISSTNTTNQNPSNQAKEILSKHEDITSVKAVNTDKHLVIAMEIEHNKRFRLAQLREQRTKEMKESFPDMKVEFSTDKKIILELDRIEKEIESGKLSKKELEKELKKVITLSKEQT